LTPLRGGDPVLDLLLRAPTDEGLTREAYLQLAYLGDDLPDPWTAEHELELPDPLQDPSKLTG
jgi:hypothetical protein